jgi:ankyrin repeat protein
MFASMQGSEDIVRMLLDKEAEINTTNQDGDTALIIAKRKKNKAILKLLKDKIKGKGIKLLLREIEV